MSARRNCFDGVAAHGLVNGFCVIWPTYTMSAKRNCSDGVAARGLVNGRERFMRMSGGHSKVSSGIAGRDSTTGAYRQNN